MRRLPIVCFCRRVVERFHSERRITHRYYSSATTLTDFHRMMIPPPTPPPWRPDDDSMEERFPLELRHHPDGIELPRPVSWGMYVPRLVDFTIGDFSEQCCTRGGVCRFGLVVDVVASLHPDTDSTTAVRAS
jgi:hypothetical protein